MISAAQMTNEELFASMARIGKECGAYAAISSQFQKRRNVEDRRSILVRELMKRGLGGMRSKKRRRF